MSSNKELMNIQYLNMLRIQQSRSMSLNKSYLVLLTLSFLQSNEVVRTITHKPWYVINMNKESTINSHWLNRHTHIHNSPYLRVLLALSSYP